MAVTFEKVDDNTLKKIETSVTTESTIDKAEIQTKIDHLEQDKDKTQLEIDELKSQIEILTAISVEGK